MMHVHHEGCATATTSTHAMMYFKYVAHDERVTLGTCTMMHVRQWHWACTCAMMDVRQRHWARAPWCTCATYQRMHAQEANMYITHFQPRTKMFKEFLMIFFCKSRIKYCFPLQYQPRISVARHPTSRHICTPAWTRIRIDRLFYKLDYFTCGN